MTSRRGTPAISPARLASMDILERVEGGAFAGVLIAATADSFLKREDRALVQELVLGVLRWRKNLDYFIQRYSGRPATDLDLGVLIALRLGLYQLRHLSRIPPSAAVNESVSLVRRAGLGSAASLVNAVLRRAARSLSDDAGADLTYEEERLAVEVSHPEWMLERWTRAFGPEQARAIAIANNQAPQAAFRVNTLKSAPDRAIAGLEQEGVRFAPSPIVPGAFIAQRGAALARAASAREGLIHLQDQASQLVSILLSPQPGQRVLDLCAAPGSKTSHIAALTGNQAAITACDLHPQRLATLTSICNKLGVEAVDRVAADATIGLPFTPAPRVSFDRVLVDAPCSGTGTLRENPEIKWRLSPADIPRLAAAQLELMKRGAEAVGSGGRLVYSTCSIEPEENEGVLGRFLDQGAPFEIVKPEAHADLITADGFVRTFPHLHGCDGFFAAVLARK